MPTVQALSVIGYGIDTSIDAFCIFSLNVKNIAVIDLQAVADIDFFCQDEYLKYIGWMCSDRSELVRKQAIRAIQKIVEKANESEALQSFVEHFIDRFVEIAAGDIDGEISLEMITALRAMQNQGLIDFVPEQQLDLVDKVQLGYEPSLLII